jgi:hypothetical protein
MSIQEREYHKDLLKLQDETLELRKQLDTVYAKARSLKQQSDSQSIRNISTESLASSTAQAAAITASTVSTGVSYWAMKSVKGMGAVPVGLENPPLHSSVFSPTTTRTTGPITPWNNTRNPNSTLTNSLAGKGISSPITPGLHSSPTPSSTNKMSLSDLHNTPMRSPLPISSLPLANITPSRQSSAGSNTTTTDANTMELSKEERGLCKQLMDEIDVQIDHAEEKLLALERAVKREKARRIGA